MQCRLDSDNSDEDPLLELYAVAAQRMIESHTGRKLYTPEELPATAPENALSIDGDITLAALLLVNHWFKNREAASEVANKPLPLGFDALIGPHRWINV